MNETDLKQLEIEKIKLETQLIIFKRKTESLRTIFLGILTISFAIFVYKVDTQAIINACL